MSMRPPPSDEERGNALKALDAKIAQTVNGWRFGPDPEGRGYRGDAWRSEGGLLACAPEDLPAYSRDANLCLEMIESIAPEARDVEIRRRRDGVWTARIEDRNRRELDVVAKGKTMEEAVCAAAIGFRMRRSLENRMGYMHKRDAVWAWRHHVVLANIRKYLHYVFLQWFRDPDRWCDCCCRYWKTTGEASDCCSLPD